LEIDPDVIVTQVQCLCFSKDPGAPTETYITIVLRWKLGSRFSGDRITKLGWLSSKMAILVRKGFDVVTLRHGV
jgi:hypothetical protein